MTPASFITFVSAGWSTGRRCSSVLTGSSSVEILPGIFSKTRICDLTVLNFAGVGSTDSTNGRAGDDGVSLLHDFPSFLLSLWFPSFCSHGIHFLLLLLWSGMTYHWFLNLFFLSNPNIESYKFPSMHYFAGSHVFYLFISYFCFLAIYFILV